MRQILSISLFVLIFSSLLLPFTISNVQAQVPSDTSQAAEASRAGCSTNEVVDARTGGCIPAFTPLVGIPYIDTDDGNMSLPKYVNALYTASISIAAFLAVVKIIFAGVKYMLSDVVTTKADAKKDIRGALIGLLIVVGAVLILNTINPELKGLKALDGPPVNVGLTGPEGNTSTGLNANFGCTDSEIVFSQQCLTDPRCKEDQRQQFSLSGTNEASVECVDISITSDQVTGGPYIIPCIVAGGCTPDQYVTSSDTLQELYCDPLDGNWVVNSPKLGEAVCIYTPEP